MNNTLHFSQEAWDRIHRAEQRLQPRFAELDALALANQSKVLSAFQKNQIALRHFNGTTGYGYDDIGRDALARVYADVFHTEAALVSPHILSGTHALTVALFGILRPGDTLVSVIGKPYDTMDDVIRGEGIGSLKDFGILYDQIDLRAGALDLSAVEAYVKSRKPKMIYLQRSRGYEWRAPLTICDIEKLVNIIRAHSPASVVFVDNCYGEFVDRLEPTDVGADLVAGSLIKNIGGGVAPNGGYIAGKRRYIDLVANRLTAPSVGAEIGSYYSGYQYFYQGLFLAPHVTVQAIKGALLMSAVFSDMGYPTLPGEADEIGDIICSIEFPGKEELIRFCQKIQQASPVDSHVTPEPWDMPGYTDPVIMAAGCFVQGSSIELSCDSPIKKPYIAYAQGGLTYEHVKLAVLSSLDALL